MSATAATARYVITADDKTKAAIASINQGFRGMERGIKSTVRGINTTLGLIAGVGIKRAFQSVFRETAKESKEFAFALDEVKRSARSLLAAKEGAPAATAAMKELAEVLKDPEVVAAADAIASVFIRGAAGAVKFAAGVQTLEEQLEQLKRRRESLAAGEGDKRRTFIKGEPSFNPNAASEIFGINAEIGLVERKIRDRDAAAAKELEAFWQRVDAAAERASRRFETMRQFAENVKFLEDVEKRLSEGPSGDREFFEQLSREGDMTAVKSQLSFLEDMDQAARDVGETMESTGDSIDQVGDAIGRSIDADMWSDWAEAGKEAVRGIQRATVDWLMNLDDTKDSLKGLVDLLRQIAFETAVSGLFKPKAQGGAGWGDAVSDFIGGFFGAASASSSSASASGWSGPRYASGTDYVPRDQLALVHRGEAIIPAQFNTGGMGGALNVTINNNIDARGSTKDAVLELNRAMPEILRKHGEQIESRIVGRLKSGRYG